MTEIKEPPQGNNEKIIEQLKNENADLRKKIKVLQIENASLRKKLSSSEKKLTASIVEKIPPTDPPKEQEELVALKETNYEISADFNTPSVPLSTTQKSIIQGHSRRMCPSCDNTRHQFIYEETDKTHIIMDYPRMYGKKYKCGKCGQEWKVPTSLE